MNLCNYCKKEMPTAPSTGALVTGLNLWAFKNGFCSYKCHMAHDEQKIQPSVEIETESEPKPVEFYYSREWRELRYKVLRRDLKCCLCGSEKYLHVDHIKPRSKFPELELEITNLQVLCEDCNLGKSNHYEDDFRWKT